MNSYVKLARSAVEHYVRQHDILPVPAVLPAELRQQCACYVYVLENPGRQLRMMYGEPLPHQVTLAHEIIANVLQALVSPGARPVRRAELPSLGYTVAILEPPQRISEPEHLNPTTFGLYVRSSKGKYALIMPRRAGIETAHDQIATAIREANINPHEEVATLYRFLVTYYEE